MKADAATLVPAQIPLFVDLDGTVIKTDLAEEMLARSLRSAGAMFRAFSAFRAAGLAGLKRSLAESVEFDPERLPYNQSVLDHIAASRAQGRRVVLVTAADQEVAVRVAAYLGCFDDVVGSTPGHNLKGRKKLEAMQSMAGDGPFEYLGDSRADIPIWEASAYCGFARVPRSAKHLLQDKDRVTLTPGPRKSRLLSICKAMRPHQWSKNVLIFIPLLFAHAYDDPEAVLKVVLAFIAFSLCASSVYLINDMLDIEADRAHETKRRRPFAAGDLAPRIGIAAAALLVMVAMVLAFGTLGSVFAGVLLVYFALTSAYSVFLKTYSTVDVVVLALLYTMRIIAGAAALMVFPSEWLLTFSMFFFLSLAYMKRYIELRNTDDDSSLPARNYSKQDLTIVQTFGISNGALSLMTLAQYISSDDVAPIYRAPTVLWLVLPIMMFWIYRAWMWAGRGQIGADPVVFAMRDRISQICVIFILAIVMFAHRVSLDWLPT
jgi:4-hydroxybenzoate polyprenyltransferase/phosphoserine phosphatase